MKELVKVELFGLLQMYDWLCITTNGATNKDGDAVMGRGCALQAKGLWPGIEKNLAYCLRTFGNVPARLMQLGLPSNPDYKEVWSFPVKHVWSQPADIRLIAASAKLLCWEADRWYERTGRDPTIILPRPGCGNGKLNWLDVRYHLQQILDDRFTVVTNEAA